MRINGKKVRTLMEAVVDSIEGLVWLFYVRIMKNVENLSYCGC